MKPTILFLVALLGFGSESFSQTVAHSCIAPHYKLVPVPMRPSHIADTGVVAGTTPQRHAAVWSEHGALEQAAIPPGFNIAEGMSINRAGVLIGVATTADGTKRHGFLFRSGKLTLLPGQQSKPTAINEAGVVVGESVLPKKQSSGAAMWQDGSLIDLGACCGGGASGINNKGQIIGQIYDKDSRYHAFLWNHGQIIMIGSPDEYTSPVAIDDLGRVVVQTFPGNLLYEDGKLTSLTFSTKFPSQPRAMNNCGAIVGSFGPHSDALRAFIWDKSNGFVDLNQRIAAGTGWTLEVASGINNDGAIVGWGDYKKDEDAGFLLVPEW